MKSLLAALLLLTGCGPQGATGPEPQAAAPPPAAPPAPAPAAPPGPPAPPPPSTGFVRFLLVGDEAGCPPQAHGDCHSSAELLADRRLRLDAWGAPGQGVGEASVPEDAFSAAVARLTAPEVASALSSARACPQADATESMTLRIGTDEHASATGACNTEPVQAARGVLLDLCARLFPDRSLISPPF